MARRPLLSIRSINPVPAEKFEDWALSTDGRAVLEGLLDIVADPERELVPARGDEEAPPLHQPPQKITGSQLRAQARRRLSTRALALVAAGALVLLAFVAWGAYTLIEGWSHDQTVVVITDDPMSPTGIGSSVSMVKGVYRLSYGQTANINGLDITVTIRPTSVPFTESDPHPIGSFPAEPDDRQLRSRLRSQYIITNTGSEAQMVDLRRFVALGEDGNRYSLMAQPLELEPAETLSGRLDFYVDNSVAASTVAYTTDYGADDLAVWGPEAISEGPGYPVLQKLPLLRAEEVESFEYEGWDEQGRPLPVQTVTAAENPAGVAALIGLYGQTKLDPAQGYPNYTTPVHLTLYLKDGTDFSIWIEAPDSDACIIQDTRATTDGNPPAATGTNPALVRAFYGLEGAYGGTGWKLNPSEGGSVTTSTARSGTITDSSPTSRTATTQAPSGPRLSWGDAATLEGRMVTVTKPVEDANARGAHPGWKAYYCTVTITNTGDDPLDYSASEFTLEGNSSGSVGTGAPGIVGDSNPTVGGDPFLKAGTVEPGRSITAVVWFSLDGKDDPVKMRLGTATSTGVTLASWQ